MVAGLRLTTINIYIDFLLLYTGAKAPVLFLVKFRVEGIEVLGIQLILDQPEPFAETLEVYDLSLTQETDRFCNLLILDQTQNVIVSSSGFLLWYDFTGATF